MKSVTLSFHSLLKFIIFSFIFLACSEQPDIKISEQKFIDLYAHLLILDEIGDDSTRLTIRREYLSEQEISSWQIDSTLVFYKRNPDLWPEIMRQIRDRIKELRADPILTDSLRSD